MSHYVSTKPYYLLTGVPNPTTILYGANTIGNEIAAPDSYGLEEFDTEPEIAARVDAIVGEVGYYYKCENRITYPPNPVEWDCTE